MQRIKSKLNIIIYTFVSCLVFSSYLYALPAPDISAQGAILIEPTTNTILYSKNANQKFYPASTTKILTSLILIEDMPPHQILTKSANSIKNVPSDSSHIGLQVGDQYNYLDGLHAILMSSDNFVSYDMATFNAGTQKDFALKMNEKAKALGAVSSNFINPHGYHNLNHYTTPYDLAQIAKSTFANETLVQIAGTPKYNFSVVNKGKTISLKHTAPLLDTDSPYYNKAITAVKTGYHTPAGRTLVAKAVYNNIELIGVVMKTDNPNQFLDMNALFKYGHENFNLLSLGEGINSIENISYSPWAKTAIDYALSKGWIPRSTRNYMSFITANELILLLQKVVGDKEAPSLYQYDSDNQDAIYHMNTPITRQDTAYILNKLCKNLLLGPYRYYDRVEITDIANLPDYYQEAIKFTASNKLLGSATGAFNPSGNLSYEQAIVIAYKLDILYRTSIPYIFQ